MKKYYITKEGYEKLEQEIETLESLIKGCASGLRNEDLQGKITDNPSYMESRFEAMYTLPKRKEEKQMILENSVIIEETEEYMNWDKQTVIHKCRVTMLIEGEEETYDILGTGELDLDKGIISCDAPIVKSLLGHKVDDVVNFNEMNIKILNIEEVPTNNKVRKL